jgi:hypothetical protein
MNRYRSIIKRSFPALTVLALCCLFASTGLLTGCNMFEPREAQPPGVDEGVPYFPPNDASGVFANLRSGIENLAQGGNYERSLADNFFFVPLDQDAIDPSLPQGIFLDWTKDVELQVLQLMISESADASVVFRSTPQINENDFVQFRVIYELNLTAKAGGAKSEIQGVAEMDMRRIGGIWQLEKWRDVERVENFTTWGYLRGTLRAKLGGAGS